jgi:predicted DsbA family dithiol-disulfide isomerase
VHFPLHPDTPIEGQSLKQMFGPGKDIDEMNRKMKALMENEGLAYNNRDMTYNSRLAQELGSWADTQLNGENIHNSIYESYFVHQKNIAEKQVLIDIAINLGFDELKIKEVLENRTFEKQVDADWSKARNMGVTGVPTFVAGGAALVGAQPYEAIVDLINNAQNQN